jgi:hypothetical protein
VACASATLWTDGSLIHNQPIFFSA